MLFLLFLVFFFFSHSPFFLSFSQYIQSILAATAIDRLASRLIRPQDGRFDLDYYARVVNRDEEFVRDVRRGMEMDTERDEEELKGGDVKAKL